MLANQLTALKRWIKRGHSRRQFLGRLLGWLGKRVYIYGRTYRVYVAYGARVFVFRSVRFKHFMVAPGVVLYQRKYTHESDVCVYAWKSRRKNSVDRDIECFSVVLYHAQSVVVVVEVGYYSVRYTAYYFTQTKTRAP